MSAGTAMSATNMLLGGVSEDKQVAMTIALSMQDQKESKDKVLPCPINQNPKGKPWRLVGRSQTTCGVWRDIWSS